MKYNISALSVALLLGFMAFALTPVKGANPYKMKYTDNDWISITGDVQSTTTEAFTLDFGQGLITVEMDDWDWYDEADLLKVGEKVTVYGRIDDGLYETRKIEANSVYAHDRNTYFYANDADEEGDYMFYTYYTAFPVTVPDGTWMSASGTIKEINGRELTLDIGTRNIIIDTDEMSYNPLDDVGYQKIDKGDRIYVSGKLDIDFFEHDEIKALIINNLEKDKTKKTNKS